MSQKHDMYTDYTTLPQVLRGPSLTLFDSPSVVTLLFVVGKPSQQITCEISALTTVFMLFSPIPI